MGDKLSHNDEYDRIIDHLRTGPDLDERTWSRYLNAILKQVERCLPSVRCPDLRGPFQHPDVIHPIWLLGPDGDDDDPIQVTTSVERKPDGFRWYHVSFKRKDVQPTAEDVRAVREAMFRRSSVVVQVFPPVSEYVNLHVNVLHLWERLGGNRLIPDLRESNGEGRLEV